MAGRDEPLVLVIDADDDIRSTACELLRDHGYRALCVLDEESARDALADLTPAVVVLCWDLPSPRARKLQLLELIPRGSALIVTSTRPEARRDAEAEGLPFLSKPFGIDDFARTVAVAARRHRG